jgi:predicted transport protein
MPLFKIDKNNASLIDEKKIKLEADLQLLCESNLETIFGLRFIASEFQVGNLRIDTLAFDDDSKSFVIIEYKRDRSFSVVDQGFAYLALMLNNKAEFILEYNETNDKHLKRDDVDWSQSKVIFVAHSFTVHQKGAINFKDLPIELWEVKQFENNTMHFDQVQRANATESIKTIRKDQQIEKVSREVKRYTVDDHFKPGWKLSRETYESLRDQILAVDSRIEESPKKIYIGFKLGSKLLAGVHVLKGKLILFMCRTQPKELKDPDGKVVYRNKCMEHYNQHISDFHLKEVTDVDYAVFLFKQVLTKFAKSSK